MTSMTPDNKRRPLPRWRSASQAAACGELRSADEPVQATAISARDFEELLAAWKTDRNVENAADLVATGLVLGRIREAEDAARFLSREDADAAPLVRQMANQVLGAQTTNTKPAAPEFQLDREVLHASIARSKLRVRAYPRNPIAWMELARCQTVLGQHRAAARAVRVALGLAGENRYVLRSATRFFVHVDEYDRALAVLRRSKSLRTDPWLMSAELSVSMIAGVDPQSYRRAKALVEADDLEPWHTGELHGALGTMALSDRRVGKVGKLFARSLRKPTENAVAQAQWAANTSAAVAVPDAILISGHFYEATALRARAQGEWNQVIHACRGWGAMEPTSARPLVLGAFCAGVALGDGVAMLQFTERLLLGASAEPMVLNNHAVALAYAGRLDDAQATLDTINPKSLNERVRVFYEATRGLIAYRRGDRDTGMQLYLKAAELPGAKEDPVVLGQLMWHLLREEARLQVPGTKELAELLAEKTEGLPLPELKGVRNSVFEALASNERAGPRGASGLTALRREVVAQLPDGTSPKIAGAD